MAGLAAITVSCGLLTAAELNNFIAPLGCDWGRLLFTNYVQSRAFAVAPCQEGFIVAGEARESDRFWGSAALAVLDWDGTVLRTNVFHGPTYPEVGRLAACIRSIRQSYGTNGLPDGYVFTGYQMQFFQGIPGDPRPEWMNPSLWIGKVDLTLQKLWETNLARGVAEYAPSGARWGTGIAQTSDGYLVLGQENPDYEIAPYDTAPGEQPYRVGCLAHLDHNGAVLLFRQSQHAGWEWLAGSGASLAETPEGSVTAGREGVTKLSPSFTPDWTRALDTYSYAVTGSPEGYVAVGRQRPVLGGNSNWHNVVLTRLDGAGAIQGTNVFGTGSARDLGRDVHPTSDGFMIAGQTDSAGQGGTDFWVIKTDSTGALVWDVPLGGTGNDRAYALTEAPSGHFVIGGQANAHGSNWMWVVSLSNHLHAPLPAFEYTPVSPVFRDVDVLFDASASSNPGSSIIAYTWDFGDGVMGTGELASHSYRAAGLYTVTLTVTSADGPMRSISHEVEVIGLQTQWTRSFGRGWQDFAISMVPSRDEGFVIAGASHSSWQPDNHMWVFKTDGRGRLVWEQFLDHPTLAASEEAHSVIAAHDSGYLVLGGCSSSLAWSDLLVARVGEDGALLEPVKAWGEPGQFETGWGMAATADGGYVLTGTAYLAENGRENVWIIKTDGTLTQTWNRILPTAWTSSGRSIAPTRDGGYVIAANFSVDAHANPFWVFGTDATGVPLWTNRLGGQYGGHPSGSGRWIAERPAPEEGSVLVGQYDRDIAMFFLDPLGNTVATNRWTGNLLRQRSDIGNHGTLTSDGGYLLTGVVDLPTQPGGYGGQMEVALVKTDAAGQEQWVEYFPGTTNQNEEGLASVALPDGSYVILGRCEVGQDRVRLWKLAPNHPPIPRLQISTNVSRVGEAVTFDGSGSSDRDGTVALHEWNFGDGHSATNPIVTHIFTNAGMYVVQFTAVDNQGAERSLTCTNYVSGVATDGTGFAIVNSTITNCPPCDPTNYPPQGVPLMVDWDTARGVQLQATATTASTKTIRITFDEPVQPSAVLYRLPAWAVVPYTLLNPHTIEVRLYLYSGEVDLSFVLAEAAPLPSITRCERVAGSRLALTVNTTLNYVYRVVQTPALAPLDWQPVNHARIQDEPTTHASTPGTGSPATLFIEVPSTTAFFRIVCEPGAP